MTTNELNEILVNHLHWVNEDVDNWGSLRANLEDANLRCMNLQRKNLRGANLRNAKLCDAYLRGADLRTTDLYKADLRNVDLRNADLSKAHLSKAHLSGAILKRAVLYDANLYCASLRDADLSHADLQGADLRHANLRNANLYCANLKGANLQGANLRNANLCNANCKDTILHDTVLTGANLNSCFDIPAGNHIDFYKGKILTEPLIGFKKCEYNAIVTLEIPRGAIVFSINGKECRTNKARVIAIDGADRAFSIYNHMVYYVGDEFTIYDFNCQYNIECGEGIHFFLNRKDAEKY